MVDLLTLQLQLSQAEVALHQLQLGQGTASVSYEGKSVTYQQADRFQLGVYINSLRDQIAGLQGTPNRRGPIYMEF